MLTVYDLRTEHLSNPLGIDNPKPRFSWKISGDRRNTLQETWRIIARHGNSIVWDSNVVKSCESLGVIYGGSELKSRQSITWELFVTANGESAAGKAGFEMGLLEKNEWKAKWIESEEEVDDLLKPQPSPYLRKRFTVKNGLIRARAYQTAHGLYRYWINGESAGDRVFMPGNTSYYKRLQYQTDDIADKLSQGENIWAVRLGDGWWRGAVGAFKTRNNYGDKLQFLGQLVLEYADGSVEYVISDESFKASTGGLLQCDPMFGTVYDAAKEPVGWKRPAFDDKAWRNVHHGDGGYGDLTTLISEASVKVKEKERFEGRPFIDSEGNKVIDFGQNIAGYVSMTIRNSKPGQKITLEHGEGLRHGCFDFSNVILDANQSNNAFQTVIYYAKGEPEEYYCPEFSVFGFRYIRITGYDQEIMPGDFTAIAVYSDLYEAGAFKCSDDNINKLFQNIRWSQKGNFLDVPTDCPTRERAPWSGDAQIFCKTATELTDVYTFFEKWMQEIVVEQAYDGQIPSIVPSIMYHNASCRDAMSEAMSKRYGDSFDIMGAAKSEIGEPNMIDGAAGWGDVATIVPYTIYLCYGDRKILENQYLCAKKWVDYMITHAKNPNPLYKNMPEYDTFTDGICDAEYIWDTDFHWGEWSEPDFDGHLPEDFVGDRIRKGNALVATAYLTLSARLLSKIASVLDNREDAEKYFAISEKTKTMYDKYFCSDDGSILRTDQNRQAPLVRVLAFELCSERKRSAVAKYLVKLIKENDYHLNTGFLSTPLLLNVLADTGYSDIAYKLLEQTSSPSWLYPVTEGATTILESWVGLQTYFGSFNHYSYGAVSDFLFSHVCGIKPCFETPGYKHFILEPLPGGTLTNAEYTFESPYGKIYSSWKRDGEKTEYRFIVPANTTASIHLPGKDVIEVGSGEYNWRI
ncbi:MAG: glycoside hydrolase family 78 protein [Treponema sp.]|jgi:alpha-L-rhamnosidase|nr:glycoside hydrolase family 78 protein [Treponema sp.]